MNNPLTNNPLTNNLITNNDSPITKKISKPANKRSEQAIL